MQSKNWITLEGAVDYWEFEADLLGGKTSGGGNNGFRVDNEKCMSIIRSV